jgi:hypothetical protein
MEELDKRQAMALHGLRVEEIVARADRQIESWGLAMPPAEPLSFDFGLEDFERFGRGGVLDRQ